jgi:hypothetical protein
MKRRIRKVVNFFAFNLLFFALYLNFIHKDKPNIAVAPSPSQVTNTASLSGTVLVSNPEKYLEQKNNTTSAENKSAQETQPVKTEETAALKLSVN